MSAREEREREGQKRKRERKRTKSTHATLSIGKCNGCSVNERKRDASNATSKGF